MRKLCQNSRELISDAQKEIEEFNDSITNIKKNYNFFNSWVKDGAMFLGRWN